MAWQLDSIPPEARVIAPGRVAPGVPFTVTWMGQDGVGIASYDVQVGTEGGVWKDWLQGTTLTEAEHPPLSFGGLWLRARAQDLAGNVGPWSAPQYVTVGKEFRFLPLPL
jgi:hypothetical protein